MQRTEPDRSNVPACTLCHAPATHLAADRRRSFYRCGRCTLVFADPASHLDPRADWTQLVRLVRPGSWLGAEFGLSVETVGNDVILMRRR